MTTRLKEILDKWFECKDFLFKQPEFVRHSFNEKYFRKLYKKVEKFPIDRGYEFIQEDYANTFHRYLRLNYDVDLTKSVKYLYFKHIGK